MSSSTPLRERYPDLLGDASTTARLRLVADLDALAAAGAPSPQLATRMRAEFERRAAEGAEGDAQRPRRPLGRLRRGSVVPERERGGMGVRGAGGGRRWRAAWPAAFAVLVGGMALWMAATLSGRQPAPQPGGLGVPGCPAAPDDGSVGRDEAIVFAVDAMREGYIATLVGPPADIRAARMTQGEAERRLDPLDTGAPGDGFQPNLPVWLVTYEGDAKQGGLRAPTDEITRMRFLMRVDATTGTLAGEGAGQIENAVQPLPESARAPYRPECGQRRERTPVPLPPQPTAAAIPPFDPSECAAGSAGGRYIGRGEAIARAAASFNPIPTRDGVRPHSGRSRAERMPFAEARRRVERAGLYAGGARLADDRQVWLVAMDGLASAEPFEPWSDQYIVVLDAATGRTALRLTQHSDLETELIGEEGRAEVRARCLPAGVPVATAFPTPVSPFPLVATPLPSQGTALPQSPFDPAECAVGSEGGRYIGRGEALVRAAGSFGHIGGRNPVQPKDWTGRAERVPYAQAQGRLVRAGFAIDGPVPPSDRQVWLVTIAEATGMRGFGAVQRDLHFVWVLGATTGRTELIGYRPLDEAQELVGEEGRGPIWSQCGPRGERPPYPGNRSPGIVWGSGVMAKPPMRSDSTPPPTGDTGRCEDSEDGDVITGISHDLLFQGPDVPRELPFGDTWLEYEPDCSITQVLVGQVRPDNEGDAAPPTPFPDAGRGVVYVVRFARGGDAVLSSERYLAPVHADLGLVAKEGPRLILDAGTKGRLIFDLDQRVFSTP